MRKRDYIFLFLLFATFAYANQGAPPSFPVATQVRAGKLQSTVVDQEAVNLQNEILKELKILNIYMTKITGDKFTEIDIE